MKRCRYREHLKSPRGIRSNGLCVAQSTTQRMMGKETYVICGFVSLVLRDPLSPFEHSLELFSGDLFGGTYHMVRTSASQEVSDQGSSLGNPLLVSRLGLEAIDSVLLLVVVVGVADLGGYRIVVVTTVAIGLGMVDAVHSIRTLLIELALSQL